MSLTTEQRDYLLACDVSEDDMLRHVCNHMVALPEHGIESKPLHMPVMWLGSTSDELILDVEAEERAMQQRIGWKSGPRVMLIGPYPAAEDFAFSCALMPSTTCGCFVRQELDRVGIAINDVMMTHACRFQLPSTVKTYKSQHFSSNAAFVVEDIEQCRPEVIITFGAQALKSLFGQKTKLESVRGDVLTYKFRDGNTCKVVPTASYLSFLGSHADIDQFRIEMQRAADILNGKVIKGYEPKDYRVLTTADEVEALCKELAENPPKKIAFDTEFGNDVAREEFSYTLSVQLAWAKGCAAFIQFRHHVPQDPYEEVTKVGKPRKDGTYKTRTRTIHPGPKTGVRLMSEADENRCWAALQKLFLDERIQLVGQHLRVDVNQFYKAGYPIDMRIADGFDTMLVHYLLKGDDSHGLDHLVRSYVPFFGAYWRDLEEWQVGKGAKLDYGFRDIPPEILIPYGLKDADATLQVAELLEQELEAKPKLKQLYWNLTSWTSLHLLDVERQGLLVDEDRRMELRNKYLPVYEDLKARLEKVTNWPGFSVSSRTHIQYLMFSDHLYKDRHKGREECPADANLLHLRPLYNTDKYPRPWDDVEAEGDAAQSTPSTEVDVMDILCQEHPELEALTLLKHISVLGKFLSTYLVPVTMNNHGVIEDGKGFHNNIRSDGRVTTRLSQLTATGRYTSQKANLQVQPKKQEAAIFEALVYHKFGISVKEYERRTVDANPKKGIVAYEGPDRIEEADRIHTYKFKSCIIAPEGYSLIEADFKTAEVFVWAFCSGDPELIRVVTSGRDIHSEVAISAYNLPMKGELEGAITKFMDGDKEQYLSMVKIVKDKYEALRTSAKACIAEGTPVLTEIRGWVPIEQVSLDDRIWDGSTWVSHGGVVCKGVKKVIEVSGVWMTPDHEVLTHEGWQDAAHAVQIINLSKLGTYSDDGRLSLLPSLALERRPLKSLLSASAATEKYLRETPTATFGLVRVDSAGRVAQLDRGTPAMGVHAPRAYSLPSSQINVCEDHYWIDTAHSSPGAATYKACTIPITGAGASTLIRHFWTQLSFLPTLERWTASIIQSWKSTVSITVEGIGEATSGLLQETNRWLIGAIHATWTTPEKPCLSYSFGEGFAQAIAPTQLFSGSSRSDTLQSELLKSSRSVVARVYDVVNAGPYLRYQAGSLVVANCLFGIMYGRSANALSRAITSAGTPTSPEDCQQIINGISTRFPVAWKWLQGNMDFAVEHGYLENVFGACRYFPGVQYMSKAKQSAVRREASNSNIQGAVAYLLAQAGVNFYKFKYMTEIGKTIDFRILLPIHDAFLFEVRDDHVKKLKGLIGLCMSTANKIPGTDNYLGVDIEVAKRWGEKAH